MSDVCQGSLQHVDSVGVKEGDTEGGWWVLNGVNFKGGLDFDYFSARLQYVKATTEGGRKKKHE